MIKKNTMFCYGFLAMPLAFIAISLFVFIPKIYHEQYGISLATIISIFVITKLLNFAALPYIGIYLDKLNLRRIYRKKIIYVCLPLLALSFNFLIFPPFSSEFSLIFFYLITCILYSFIAINYYAMSIELTREYRGQNFLSGYREMFTLVGFLMATLLSTMLTKKYSFTEAYNNIIFVIIFMMFAAGTLLHFVKVKHSFVFHPELSLKKVLGIFRSFEARRFLTTVLINGVAVALPITTSFFFIKYVLKAEDLTGYYLLAYYSCGILSIPFWVKFANKNGKKYSWIISMIVSSIFFFAAFFLGEGDRIEFYVICITTGVCLGADVLLSPSIFSDNVENKQKAGCYYSLWILVQKLSMSICVILSLVALGIFDLEAKPLISAKDAESAILVISFLHSIVPAILKMTAAFLLIKNKVDIKFSK